MCFILKLKPVTIATKGNERSLGGDDGYVYYLHYEDANLSVYKGPNSPYCIH